MRAPTWLLVVIAAVAAAGVLSRTGAAKHPPAGHVVVISIDGLMPEDVFGPSGIRLPAIAALRTTGAAAEGLEGVAGLDFHK